MRAISLLTAVSHKNADGGFQGPLQSAKEVAPELVTLLMLIVLITKLNQGLFGDAKGCHNARDPSLQSTASFHGKTSVITGMCLGITMPFGHPSSDRQIYERSPNLIPKGQKRGVESTRSPARSSNVIRRGRREKRFVIRPRWMGSTVTKGDT